LENFQEARDVFDRAGQALGQDLAGLCLRGPEAELTRTVNAQPAILASSIAIFEVLKARGLAPEAVAGLSLGEYTALVAAGAIDFSAALTLVRARGTYMQEAVPEGEGAMAAIIGLDEAKVRDICAGASGEGLVEPANLNSPGQIIVSGRVQGIHRAASLARAAGGSVIPLKVSAPFHCSLMRPAAARLERDLDRTEIRRAALPVFANVSANVVRSPAEIKQALLEQVYSPVLWDRSVRAMIAYGVRAFVELGPGKTLTSLIRKIDRSVSVFSVQDVPSVDAVLSWKEAAAVGS
ncbi:MAG: ACP S-malonyltransferase, partial [Bacillota bacterium]